MTSPTPPARRFNSRSTAGDVLKGVDLSGRTIAITGTTNGIGVETARALALANAHVVMLCRNTRAADELRVKIVAEKVIRFVSCAMKHKQIRIIRRTPRST